MKPICIMYAIISINIARYPLSSAPKKLETTTVLAVNINNPIDLNKVCTIEVLIKLFKKLTFPNHPREL